MCRKPEKIRSAVVDGIKYFLGIDSKSKKSSARTNKSRDSEPFHYVRSVTRSLLQLDADESEDPWHSALYKKEYSSDSSSSEERKKKKKKKKKDRRKYKKEHSSSDSDSEMPQWVKTIIKREKEKMKKEKNTGERAHESSASLKKFVLPTSPAKDDA